MAKQTLGRLKPFTTIGKEERVNILKALKSPLSGYIGGAQRGGHWCDKLERDWCKYFEVPHAVPCNSATSGLLAACLAADIGFGDPVWVTDYSMSATAAVAQILGAKITFVDIDDDTFNMAPYLLSQLALGELPKAVIVTNLFGNPAHLFQIKQWCDAHQVIMIEDNAQAPGAMEGRFFAGTVGHMGVFSLNIHKHIQAGEGGIVVCRDPQHAIDVRDAINHGELRAGRGMTGLNLRMTETTAAIACAQLRKLPGILDERIHIARSLTLPLLGNKNLIAPMEDPACRHVYYLWALRAQSPEIRDKAMRAFTRYRFPIRAGYVPPLHTLFTHSGIKCPVTERVEETIMVYENCTHTPTKAQLKQMQDILKRVGDAVA